MDYRALVRDVIESYRVSPIDMLGTGDLEGEYVYLRSQADSYVRTVREVDTLCISDRSDRHILELGSFLGPVSISLKRIGYDVSALDIPEFYECASLRTLYEAHGIPYCGVNLNHLPLPYASNSFDVVIACEVLEHLNFNPLPVLQEINRVMKTDGYVYIGMPNQSRIVNRVKLLRGESVHNPIQYFFRQLDRNDNMIVGLHWREYTLQETALMLELMGFAVFRKYYFKAKGCTDAGVLKAMLRDVIYSYPPFRPSQVVIGRKATAPVHNFWLTEANS